MPLLCAVISCTKPTCRHQLTAVGAGVQPEWAKVTIRRDKSRVVFRAAQMDQQAVAELQRRLEQSESDCARMERQLQQLQGKGVRPGLPHSSTSQPDGNAAARSAADGEVWQESQELLQVARGECRELEWQVHRLQGQLMDVGQGHEAHAAAGEPACHRSACRLPARSCWWPHCPGAGLAQPAWRLLPGHVYTTLTVVCRPAGWSEDCFAVHAPDLCHRSITWCESYILVHTEGEAVQ